MGSHGAQPTQPMSYSTGLHCTHPAQSLGLTRVTWPTSWSVAESVNWKMLSVHVQRQKPGQQLLQHPPVPFSLYVIRPFWSKISHVGVQPVQTSPTKRDVTKGIIVTRALGARYVARCG